MAGRRRTRVSHRRSREHRADDRVLTRRTLRTAPLRDVQVTSADVVDTPTGTHLRVWEDVAKQEHYREPPVPEQLVTYIDAHTDAAGIRPGEPIFNVADKTMYCWVCQATERLQTGTGDHGWSFLDVHELRRT